MAYGDEMPMIVGQIGTSRLLSPWVACVDSSAGHGGPLVAYRWEHGDTGLRDDCFVVW